MSSTLSLKKGGVFAQKGVRLFLIPFAVALFMVGWILLCLGEEQERRKRK